MCIVSIKLCFNLFINIFYLPLYNLSIDKHSIESIPNKNRVINIAWVLQFVWLHEAITFNSYSWDHLSLCWYESSNRVLINYLPSIICSFQLSNSFQNSVTFKQSTFRFWWEKKLQWINISSSCLLKKPAALEIHQSNNCYPQVSIWLDKWQPIWVMHERWLFWLLTKSDLNKEIR